MIIKFRDKEPKFADTCFIAPSATLIGDIQIGEFSSVWFNAVLRGDDGLIQIGSHTNIQDGSILHRGVNVGNYVTIAHRALLHNCKVFDGALIGAGAIIWDDVEVGENSLVGVGAVVPKGMKIRPKMLVLGIPAKEIKELSDEEIEMNRLASEFYQSLSEEYKKILK